MLVQRVRFRAQRGIGFARSRSSAAAMFRTWKRTNPVNTGVLAARGTAPKGTWRRRRSQTGWTLQAQQWPPSSARWRSTGIEVAPDRSNRSAGAAKRALPPQPAQPTGHKPFPTLAPASHGRGCRRDRLSARQWTSEKPYACRTGLRTGEEIRLRRRAMEARSVKRGSRLKRLPCASRTGRSPRLPPHPRPAWHDGV